MLALLGQLEKAVGRVPQLEKLSAKAATNSGTTIKFDQSSLEIKWAVGVGRLVGCCVGCAASTFSERCAADSYK